LARVVGVAVVAYAVDTGDLGVVATLFVVVVETTVVAEVVVAALQLFVAAAEIGQVFVVEEKLTSAAR